MAELIPDSAIVISKLSKSFRLPIEHSNGFKQLLINRLKGKKGYETQRVLKNVSFDIKKGEFFGIVGRNGGGKSTLLKLIAEIYVPEKGSVTVNGSLTPFIELGVGFNPELTGRENVFLNGALLGFSKKEINAMYDDIVDFSELHRFMDQKLKNYSSGMQVRLAFSIAIQAKSDILLLDEVLAVGDAAFQQKCTEYFEQIKHSGKTIVLVTHSMESVERFCDRAVLIENGVVKTLGSPDEVAKQYTLDNLNGEHKELSEEESLGTKNATLNKEVKSLKVKLRSSQMTTSSSTLEVDVEYELNEDIEVDLGISILYQNISVIEHNTQELTLDHKAKKKHTLRYSFPLENLNPGRYEITAAIFEKSEFKLIGFIPHPTVFIVDNVKGEPVGGILSKIGKWQVL